MAEGNGSRFEAVHYVEPDVVPGMRYDGPLETRLGVFESEVEAIEVARDAWLDARARFPKRVAWWVVRRPGEQIARWIADSRSAHEKYVDLTTMELLDSPPHH